MSIEYGKHTFNANRMSIKRARSFLRTSAQTTLRPPPEIRFLHGLLFASLLNFPFSYCVIEFLTFLYASQNIGVD